VPSRGRVAAPVALVPAALAACLVAVGWLYLIGPQDGWPGPRVGDALPLDELSHHAGSPALLFLVVWAAVGAALGLTGRLVRIDRLTGGLLLGLLVGLVVYLDTAVSIATVRQIPAQHAFDRAAGLPAVYLAAALAGLGGALLGHARPSGRRATTVMAAAVAAAGALDVVRALLPGSHALVGGLAPDAIRSAAAAFGVPVGVALLLAAHGLARGKRLAWLTATVLLTLSLALHVLHGFNDGGVLAAVVLVCLVAVRAGFRVGADPAARRRACGRLALCVAVVPLFGIAAIWVNRAAADRPFSLGFAVHETLVSSFGMGSGHLEGPFGGWFPLSVSILAAAGIAWTLAAVVAPWRYELQQAHPERELARSLVTAWGADTLSPFALRADKSYFFAATGNAFLAYRVVGGVAIVSGDPIGEPEALEPLVARFLSFARSRGWRVAVLGASEDALPLYCSLDLRTVYHGDEAILDVGAFSLEGRAIRKVRQSVQRLQRAGYTVRILRPAEVPPALRAELEQIAEAWRAGEPQKGFVMALDTLFGRDGDGDGDVFVIGCGPEGRPEGFIHFATSPAGGALSLSSMPRSRTTPNGFNEWLICETVTWAREHGYGRISLNFAPFAALFAVDAELEPLQRVERRALQSLKGQFQLDNLLHFNEKFGPGWCRRYVVVERRRDLPRVGVAALAAESYLPFAARAVE
jgi:lysyl-tRNA synthetase, class II